MRKKFGPLRTLMPIRALGSLHEPRALIGMACPAHPLVPARATERRRSSRLLSVAAATETGLGPVVIHVVGRLGGATEVAPRLPVGALHRRARGRRAIHGHELFQVAS